MEPLPSGYAVWVDVAQIMTTVLAAAIIITEFWRTRKPNGGHIAEPLLLIMWMMHTIIYYAFVFLCKAEVIHIQDSAVFFTSWSATLRFHGYTSLFVLSLLKINKTKLIKKAKEEFLNGSSGSGTP